MTGKREVRVSAFLIGAVGAGLGLVVALAACFGSREHQNGGKDLSPEAQAEFHAGVAVLEHYLYRDAYEIFERVVAKAPRHPVARFNKGLAAMNVQGAHLKIAEEDFLLALKGDPKLAHAHFSLGLLYHFTQRFEESIASFRRALELAPADAFAHYWLGAALGDANRVEESFRYFEKAVELQPALASAVFRLSSLYRIKGDKAKADAALANFQMLRQNMRGLLVDMAYGKNGPLYMAIRDPGGAGASPADAARPLELRGRVALAAPSAAPATLPNGKPARPALVVADFNADVFEDLVLCGRASSSGGAAAAELWLGAEDGSFARARALPADGIAAAAGDLDCDSDVDLVLAAPGKVTILLNDGKGTFAEAGLKYPRELPGAPLRVLVLDADSDWDLDIAIACQTQTAGATGGAIVLLNNNRTDSFEDIAERAGLAPSASAALDLLFGDLDLDIDLDLVLVTATGAQVWLNDRAWRFRAGSQLPTPDPSAGEAARFSLQTAGTESAATLEIAGGGKVAAFRFNAESKWEPWLGVRREFGPAPLLAQGHDEVCAVPGVDGARRWVLATAGQPPEVVSAEAPESWIAFELAGPKTPTIDVVGTWSNLSGIGASVEIRAGEHGWVEQLNGAGAGSARSTPRAFFALPRGTIQVDYVRVLWPDGVLQTETRCAGSVSVLWPKGSPPSDSPLSVRRVYRIEERERKTTSCPMLFAWDGERFDFVGDFLGVGGLGYLAQPGVYSMPDPTELVEIPKLAARRGDDERETFDLRLAEPLEECSYLDRAALLAVDTPPGVSVHPLEMFAVAGPPPGHELVFYRDSISPQRVLDHSGADVSAALARIDRVYAENWKKDRRFVGAAEPHAIILEFDAGLDRLVATSPRPVLFLFGYIEYGYSTSNFAAAQAKLAPRAPSFAVERQGRWVPLREDWGFPGGTPRWMAVELGGLLQTGDRRIRIDTSLEIYWDYALLAAGLSGSAEAGARATPLAAESAELRELGFPLFASDDGRHPRTYHYEACDPVAAMLGQTVRRFPGRYTRLGDVKELVGAADDRFVLFGPGDEVALRFDAAGLPPLAAGWRRRFFLEANGWCKDTDLYTAHNEQVEPLPFRAMGGYPQPAGAPRFEDDAARREFAERWLTREVPAAR